MKRILAICDDLSGAAEIAGAGARHGLPARLERDAPVIAHDGLSVIDTDSRLLPQDEAADAVAKSIRHLDPASFDFVYKKTDSALRGPVLAEIEAAMSAFGRRGALLLAQNPSRGRTIHQGEYRIDGVPLSQTAFAQDPEYPARTSDALALLGHSARTRTMALAPGSALPEGGVAIAQAEDEREVRQWARQAQAHFLPAGGADFFEALLETAGHPAAGPFLSALPPGRTLFVCGTATAFSAPLIARARQEQVTACPMPDHSAGALAAAERWRHDAQAALDADSRALLVIHRPLDPTPGAPQRYQSAIAQVVARLLADSAGADNLLLEGGATASAVCKSMGWHRFDVEGEFAPGVVQMRALRADGTSAHRVIIKPGSYPWPEAVWRATAS